MSNIVDHEVLHRRIHPDQMKDNGKPSSAAFTHLEMSVDRASIWSVEKTLHEHSDFGVAAISAGLARELKQEVAATPSLLNPSHADVIGHKPRSVSKRFSEACTLVKAPCASVRHSPVPVLTNEPLGTVADS